MHAILTDITRLYVKTSGHESIGTMWLQSEQLPGFITARRHFCIDPYWHLVTSPSHHGQMRPMTSVPAISILT